MARYKTMFFILKVMNQCVSLSYLLPAAILALDAFERGGWGERVWADLCRGVGFGH